MFDKINPKVTALLGALAVIFPEIYKAFDSIDTTTCNWGIVFGTITGFIAVLNLRRNNVSSEEAGIPPSRTGPEAYYAAMEAKGEEPSETA